MPEQEPEAAADAQSARAPAAAEGEDLSFLEGCWIYGVRHCTDEEGIYSWSGGWSEVCFDRQGQGEDIYHPGPNAALRQRMIQASRDSQGRLIMEGESGPGICQRQFIVTAIADKTLRTAFTNGSDCACQLSRPRVITFHRHEPRQDYQNGSILYERYGNERGDRHP
jgi:hypothetical protein